MREFEVNVSDLTFTPIICATLIHEILKGLLFQKNQIPYPFDWLKNVVERRRKAQNVEKVTCKSNFTFESHYRTVASTFDVLQSLKASLSHEFSHHGNMIKQVLITLGDTPFCLKEVFRIGISSITEGHIERNHVLELDRHLQKILRNIFLSESLLSTIDASHNCTSTFIFIEKRIFDNQALDGLDHDSFGFRPCRPLDVHSKVAQIKINLSTNGIKAANNCCGNLIVFDDEPDDLPTEEQKVYSLGNSTTDYSTMWYQFSQPIKGFRDCFKDKTSVCELW